MVLLGEDDDEDSSDSETSLKNAFGEKKSIENVSIEELVGKLQHESDKDTSSLEEKLSKMVICCGCLGDRSDDVNEIIECDGCGITVHEG